MEKKKIVSIIAENVRALMDSRGLSSTALAKKCKVSPGTISKILHGSMNITIPTLITLCDGLGVETQDILSGLRDSKSKKKIAAPKESELLFIGILSINNRRLTCIKNNNGDVLGTSEIDGGLDLTETVSNILSLIQQSIDKAIDGAGEDYNPKNARLYVVVQSYEFEETRNKVEASGRRSYQSIKLLPDWKLTYFAAFKEKPGISLVTDKGVSLSYRHEGKLKKLGGWKFPVYDLGGENWLGLTAIHHTIDAYEGYIPMSDLARNILAKFDGKIEKITETCMKGGKDPDVYLIFAEILIKNYLMGSVEAAEIVERGFKLAYRGVEKVDSIFGAKHKIALNGSLTDIYKKYIKSDRLIASPNDQKKVEILADFAKDPNFEI